MRSKDRTLTPVLTAMHPVAFVAATNGYQAMPNPTETRGQCVLCAGGFGSCGARFASAKRGIHNRSRSGAVFRRLTMMSSRFSALEPMFVFGLAVLFALVSFRKLSTVTTRNVQTLDAILLAPRRYVGQT